jgi:hypothetical protein
MIATRIMILETIDLGLSGENNLICYAILSTNMARKRYQKNDEKTGEDLFHIHGFG